MKIIKASNILKKSIGINLNSELNQKIYKNMFLFNEIFYWLSYKKCWWYLLLNEDSYILTKFYFITYFI